MWIEFSEFNFKLLIPLIFPVFKRVQDFTKKLYIKDSKDDKTLFKTFRYFFSYTLSFIFLIIVHVRTRKKETKIIETKEEGSDKLENKRTMSLSESLTMTNTITEIKIANKRKMRLKSYLFLGGLCLLGLFCYFFRKFFEQSSFRITKQSMGIFFDIAGYIILSYLILKQKLYLHSYVTMGIIAFVLLCLFIISIFYVEDKIDLAKSLGYYFFYSLFFVLYDVLKKKYMIMFFNTPYFMMLVIGISCTTFVLIYDLFAFIVDRENEEIAKGFRSCITGVGEAFGFILDIITQFIWNLGIWLIIYYLTPCHYFISEYISEYIYYLKNARDSKEESFYKTENIVIFSVGCFINFCCSLVFNEVVILNFCGLDYNTKKRIQQRQRTESRLTVSAQILLETDANDNEDMNSQQSNHSN